MKNQLAIEVVSSLLLAVFSMAVVEKYEKETEQQIDAVKSDTHQGRSNLDPRLSQVDPYA
jgi:hypothetical protein